MGVVRTINDDDECPGCGSLAIERKREKPNDPQGLRECRFCQAFKCCMCDMGDDVECPSCHEIQDD